MLVSHLIPVSIAWAQVPTTIEDFFHPGTQPDQSGGTNFASILHSSNCTICHEVGEPDEVPVYTRWRGSMMANSLRDPLFRAALAVANQDASEAGDLCLRCHAPGAWLAGRSTPTNGSALIEDDEDGITCNFCHRMVDPVFRSGISPREDRPILNALTEAGLLPTEPGNGSYVIDPIDVRRGPFRACADPPNCNPNDIPFNMHGVPIIYSPFHSKSEMCATCHDVSNPVYVKQPDGSYALDTLNAAHPSSEKKDMFPIERTYSEWANSAYATTGVDASGVFGGNHPTGVMHTCQDCHMPDTSAYGCVFQVEPFFRRPNVPAHDFSGGSTWMQTVIAELYPDEFTRPYLEASIDRSLYMLQNAATMEVETTPCGLRVRVINETGHKLPTGYPEGRRMWLSVEFRDHHGKPIATRGAYDPLTAELVTKNTKVYEAELGLDDAVAEATGKQAGPSFHFALNNKIYKDNRIPPRGFTNAAFEAVQAKPVGVEYADGQYWDDTYYHTPTGAHSAEVTLYFQSASKEYVTFLRDENRTNDAGTEMYYWWQVTGMSPPVVMRSTVLHSLTAGIPGDADCDADIDSLDFGHFANCLTGPDEIHALGCEAQDIDLDGDADLWDVAAAQSAFTGP